MIYVRTRSGECEEQYPDWVHTVLDGINEGLLSPGVAQYAQPGDMFMVESDGGPGGLSIHNDGTFHKLGFMAIQVPEQKSRPVFVAINRYMDAIYGVTQRSPEDIAALRLLLLHIAIRDTKHGDVVECTYEHHEAGVDIENNVRLVNTNGTIHLQVKNKRAVVWMSL